MPYPIPALAADGAVFEGEMQLHLVPARTRSLRLQEEPRPLAAREPRVGFQLASVFESHGCRPQCANPLIKNKYGGARSSLARTIASHDVVWYFKDVP